MNATRQAQKSFEGRRESEKTPAPLSANLEVVMEMCPARVGFFLVKCKQASPLTQCSAAALTRDELDRLVSQKIPGCLLSSGYCASARAHVMLHKRRLNDSHEFQESRLSISGSIRHDIHTH